MRVLTRENGVIAGGIVAAILAGGLLQSADGAPGWAPLGAFFGLAIAVPIAIDTVLERRSAR